MSCGVTLQIRTVKIIMVHVFVPKIFGMARSPLVHPFLFTTTFTINKHE